MLGYEKECESMKLCVRGCVVYYSTCQYPPGGCCVVSASFISLSDEVFVAADGAHPLGHAFGT